MHYWWWVGRMRRKKTTNQYAEEKRCFFSFDLKEESEEECLTEIGGEFQIMGLMYWKDLSPRVLLPILGIWNTWMSEAEQSERMKRVRRRAEMKQFRAAWRSCTQRQCRSRWELLCIESGLKRESRWMISVPVLGTGDLPRRVQVHCWSILRSDLHPWWQTWLWSETRGKY